MTELPVDDENSRASLAGLRYLLHGATGYSQRALNDDARILASMDLPASRKWMSQRNAALRACT